jgi:hypothetical protein
MQVSGWQQTGALDTGRMTPGPAYDDWNHAHGCATCNQWTYFLVLGTLRCGSLLSDHFAVLHCCVLQEFWYSWRHQVCVQSRRIHMILTGA